MPKVFAIFISAIALLASANFAIGENSKDKKASPSAQKAKTPKKALMTNAQKSAIVEICSKTSNGGATGFIAEINGKLFIVSNAHVVASLEKPIAKTLSGVEIPIEKLFTARNHDIAIVPLAQLPESCQALHFADDIEKFVKPSDVIAVCGNSLAAKTMLETAGNVSALGAELIELDCPFYKGNSGSPVFHIDSQKVIAVVAFVRISSNKNDQATEASRKDKNSAIKRDIRYFAFRMDTVKKWDRADIEELHRNANNFEDYEKKLSAIVAFLKANPKDESADFKAAQFHDLNKIILEYRKSSAPDRHPNARRRARRNALENISRLCQIEASRLKSYNALPSYEHYKNSLINSFEHISKNIDKSIKK